MAKKMTALIIMDGFGYRKETEGNAIRLAGTPNLDKLMAEFPNTLIGASGMDVGLPDGQMGNSEVGHTNIGAGRIVYQELTRITKSIQDGDFFSVPEFVNACANARKNGGKLHLIGLLSDGGVHSHIEHLKALIKMAKLQGLDNVYVHGIMDGRDTPPASGIEYVKQLMDYMKEIGFGKIATLSGRFWAMDRDKRWDRVKTAYEAIVGGIGNTAACPLCAMKDSYANDKTDEFVVPCVILDGDKPTATVEAGDSVIFFNFRPDRAREITRAFIEPDFADFERIGGYKPVTYVCMTRYDETFTNMSVAFKPQSLSNTLGQYLADCGKTQLRIAETEKYAHVTFFFNGGVEAAGEGEDRVLIPSPKVTTYDLKPDMSANEVTEKVLECVNSGKYDVMILNFANCDMVGHTGVMEAAIEAVRTVDNCVGKVVSAILANNGRALITADHGNADMMVDPETNQPFTAHTTNKVPFILVDPEKKDVALREGGVLADLAPTMLDLMQMPQPAEMTGTSLIAK